MSPTQYAKALVATLVGFLSGLLPSLDGSDLSAREVVTALVAGLVAGGAVFVTPNRPPAGQPSDPALSEQGHGDVGGLLYVLVTLVVLLVLLRLLHVY